MSRNEILAKKYPILLSSDLSIHDFGGVLGLEGFLKATYEFIKAERSTVTIFDGDDAGDKSRRALQSYLGGKDIAFNSNDEFVIVRDRFAIEGLLPDLWIKKIHSEHPGWFEGYAEDVEGNILPFKVKDRNKESYLNYFEKLISTADPEEWLPRWEPFMLVCENSLKRQIGKLSEDVFG